MIATLKKIFSVLRTKLIYDTVINFNVINLCICNLKVIFEYPVFFSSLCLLVVYFFFSFIRRVKSRNVCKGPRTKTTGSGRTECGRWVGLARVIRGNGENCN